MEKTELLKLRKKSKAKKPNFIRQDAHKKGEIKRKWRNPRGLQSKMRLHKKGYRKSPSQGYRSPSAVRGLHLSGLVPIVVSSKRDLENIDAKNQGIMVAKTVGMKKKIELVNYAKEKGIMILNIKDSAKFLADVEKKIKEKKEKKEARKKEKEKKEKKKEIKPKKEEKLDEKLTDEEKKEQEKKEQDKLLTKKES